MLDRSGTDRIHIYVIDGVLDFLALSPQTEEKVKVHLFERVQALVAEATALLKQASGEGTESKVD